MQLIQLGEAHKMSNTTECDLSSRECGPCQGGIPPLEASAAKVLLSALDPSWALSADHTKLIRKFTFKGFAKSVQMANLIAWLGDSQGHHPDIAFGWGYCKVTYTTHEINGLSDNDFICAAKLDRILAST